MSSIVITCKSELVLAHVQQRYQLATGQAKEQARALQQLFKNLASGIEAGAVDVQLSTTDPVAASATATLTSCATDTITVGKTTFTGTGSPTTSLHFETDGTNDADAAALCAAINAHEDTSKIVIATVAANVVTITALQKGLVGNHIALTETGTTIVCTGSGFLAGGTGGAAEAGVNYNLGIA